MKEYYLPYWGIGILAVYFFTNYLLKKKRMSMVFYLRFWNGALGTFFSGVALSGLLLVLRVQYGLKLNLPFRLLFVHVEAGIAFAVIAILHIIRHKDFFRIRK